MTNKIKELVIENLLDWTPSSKIQELLGLSSMDEAQFKKEFLALEDAGIIEREGVRRGLKFRSKMGSGEIKAIAKSTIKLEAAEEAPVKTRKSKKDKEPEPVDITSLAAEVSILPRHEFTAEVTNVPLAALVSFVLHGSSDHSHSLVIKRTKQGIVVKTYKDIYLLSDVLYTKESFNKFLKLSGLSMEVSS